MENKKYIKYLAIILFILLIVAIYLGYRYYVSSKISQLDQVDVQNQIDYSESTKRLLDEKPFIAKLPYTSANFDIYYNTVDDEIQVIMKNKGLTYNEAKQADEADVTNFLTSIGVNSQQKIVWLLEE